MRCTRDDTTRGHTFRFARHPAGVVRLATHQVDDGFLPKTALADCTREIVSATANGRNNRNLTSGCDGARESTRISDVFIPDENIDVLSHLSLLSCDAISDARIECPERGQRLRQRCGWVFDLDSTESGGKLSQRPRNVKSDRHGITCSAGAFCFSTVGSFYVLTTA